MGTMSEAHGCGLCAADRATRARFARDLRNLHPRQPAREPPPEAPQRRGSNGCRPATSAGSRPASSRSAGPTASPSTVSMSTCWNRSSPDARAPRWSHSCAGRRPRGDARAPARDGGSGDALARYDDNGNGRITCEEVRWHGIAPVPTPKRTSSPGLRFHDELRRHAGRGGRSMSCRPASTGSPAGSPSAPAGW